MPRVLVVVVILAACCGAAFAQTASGKADSLYAQVARFREQAKAAFDREMAREKDGDCQNANNTFAAVNCLGKENETTTANYTAYAGALRSLLGMGADGADQTQGPTGRPLTAKKLVTEFDATEAAWQKYREAQCTAAFDQFKSGTAAPVEAGICALMLVRSHMRELERVYYNRLHY